MSSIERTVQVSFKHQVHFTRGVFDAGNPVLLNALHPSEGGHTAKSLVVLDESLALARPALAKSIEGYFAGRVG